MSAEQDRNVLEELADEYVERYRRGDAPDIEDYVDANPELADDIRELFPVVVMLNCAAGTSGVGSGSNVQAVASAIHDDAPTVVAPGTQLGDYVLVQVIGRGGMGEVYQAEHVQLGSTVAIKLLPATLNRPNLRERFLREASAAAQMNHPNIVRVFDFGSHGETLYYVMPLIEGCGLNELLASQQPGTTANDTFRSVLREKTVDDGSADDCVSADPPRDSESDPADKACPASHSTQIHCQTTMLPTSRQRPQTLWTWVANIGSQAADALSYAHDMGVIHRDIKPSNLMLDLQGTLFVTDFGLAKVTTDNSLTGTGDVLGTLRYMPPEAFDGAADERGDVYGLGLTLYELLAGKPVFAHRDRGKLIRDVAAGNIKRLRRQIPKVPRDLERIVHKAIETDPASRYLSAEAMRDDLRRYLNGQPVAARAPSLLYRASLWIGRNRVVTVLGSGLILLLASIAFMAVQNSTAYKRLASEARQAETRAKHNLLKSKLSDARGWSTSHRPGQRVEGLGSLRQAISLARELDCFDEYEAEIHDAVVTLSTLHDVPPGDSWRHARPISSYHPMAFSANLSEYAICVEKDKAGQCEVFSTVGGRPECIERFPAPCAMRFMMQLSSDGRFLMGLPKSDQSIWVYDRKQKKAIRPAVAARANRSATLIGDGLLALVDRNAALKVFSLPDCRLEHTISLPQGVAWDDVVASHDGKHVVVYKGHSSKMVRVRLSDAKIDWIEPDGPVTAVAWRPDGRQIAIASDEITIWDLQRREICSRMPRDNKHITHVFYSGNGRLLLTSGWDHVTSVFNPLSQRQVMRCEALLQGISSDGQRIVMHSGSRFERRELIASSVVSEYHYSGQGGSFDAEAQIDARSGTLWLAAWNKIVAIDVLNRRVLHEHPAKWYLTKAAVDPVGRDIVTCLEGQLYRLPITRYEGASSSSRFRIGPPQRLELPQWPKHPDAKAVATFFDATGDKLGVTMFERKCQVLLHRKGDWVAVHKHGEPIPVAISPNSLRPLIAASTHHFDEFEVRNMQTNRVEFSLNQKQCNARFTPDGNRLLVGADTRLRLFDVETWKQLAQSDPDDWFDAGVVFSTSYDGKWVAADLRNPRGVVILNADTLEIALRLGSDHLAPESEVGQFDSTGRWLVSQRGPGVVGVWDLAVLRDEFAALGLQWPLGDLGSRHEVSVQREVDVVWE